MILLLYRIRETKQEYMSVWVAVAASAVMVRVTSYVRKHTQHNAIPHTNYPPVPVAPQQPGT